MARKCHDSCSDIPLRPIVTKWFVRHCYIAILKTVSMANDGNDIVSMVKDPKRVTMAPYEVTQINK